MATFPPSFHVPFNFICRFSFNTENLRNILFHLSISSFLVSFKSPVLKFPFQPKIIYIYFPSIFVILFCIKKFSPFEYVWCCRTSVFLFLEILFIYLFWLCWVFIAARGLSLVAATRGCSSLRWLLLWASVVVAHGLSSCGLQALERRLSSCGAWA